MTLYQPTGTILAMRRPDGTTVPVIQGDVVWSVMFQRLAGFAKAYGIDLNNRVIVDVGAARGEFLAVVVALWPKAQFHLCEADKRWEPILRSTATTASVTHDLTMMPISHTDGQMRDYWRLDERPEGLAGFYPENQAYLRQDSTYRPEPLATTTLDALQLENVGLIKVDVQGGEMDVVAGARNLLRRCQPFVLLELPLVPYNRGVPDLRASLNQMAELGYKVIDVFDVHKFKLKDDSNGEIGVQLDMLFAPEGFVDAFTREQNINREQNKFVIYNDDALL